MHNFLFLIDHLGGSCYALKSVGSTFLQQENVICCLV